MSNPRIGKVNWNNARQASGLSIRNLSEETGIRLDTLQKILRNQEEPQPHHIRALSRVLQIKL
jgi:ribosome-binding protein aMBF1 (putative translation factor)